MADETPEAPKAFQEGSRWRHERPTAEEIAAWFVQQPLDEDMRHEAYASGLVVIPNSEKVKRTRYQGAQPIGTEEVYEMLFTPYVTINTRVRYFHDLAKARGLRVVIEPVKVPRIKDPASPWFNANLEKGLWWYAVRDDHGTVKRWLCATWRVALYEPREYERFVRGDPATPVKEGLGTKQTGGSYGNAVMRAQTGAVGRALGLAGILVVGSGVASAEDMEHLDQDSRPIVEDGKELPTVNGEGEPVAPGDRNELMASLSSLQNQLRTDHKTEWEQFGTWYQERAKAEGWNSLSDVPTDALAGMKAKMQGMISQASVEADLAVKAQEEKA